MQDVSDCWLGDIGRILPVQLYEKFFLRLFSRIPCESEFSSFKVGYVVGLDIQLENCVIYEGCVRNYDHLLGEMDCNNSKFVNPVNLNAWWD